MSTMQRSPASSPAACGLEATAAGARSRSSGRAGLAGALAEAALAETYDGGDDEEAIAREALGRRAVASDADRKRAIAYLARRGFSARACLEGRSAGGRGIAAWLDGV